MKLTLYIYKKPLIVSLVLSFSNISSIYILALNIYLLITILILLNNITIF